MKNVYLDVPSASCVDLVIVSYGALSGLALVDIMACYRLSSTPTMIYFREAYLCTPCCRLFDTEFFLQCLDFTYTQILDIH